MKSPETERIVTDVVCGFCGLGCDDLEFSVKGRRIEPLKACPEAARLFARSDAPPPSPRVDGQPASLPEAAKAAARHVAQSRAAAISGLGADLYGLGRLYDLAMTAGASFDHKDSAGLFANLERLARRGWIAATLAEVRNRCDLLVVFGQDPSTAFNRFFERAMPRRAATGGPDAPPLFVDPAKARRVVVLGGPLGAAARAALDTRNLVEIPVPEGALGAVASALASRLEGKEIPDLGAITGLTGADISELADQLLAARYAVFTWAAGAMAPSTAASIAEAAARAVDALSPATRAAVFPLGGRDNVTGAHQLSLWRFGYPLRTSVGAGTARHAPELYATEAAIADADLLIHASAFRPSPVPAFTRGPVIALAHPETTFEKEPDIFIPVGTPGVDHGGHAFRLDSVVCLPLSALRAAELPSLGEAVSAILDALKTLGRTP